MIKLNTTSGGSTTITSTNRIEDITLELYPNITLSNNDVITWDGLTVTQAQCEAYGLVFGAGSTAFSAKIYPDGSIVGENSLGSFEARANGEMYCFRGASITITTSSSNVFGTTAGTIYYAQPTLIYPVELTIIKDTQVTSTARSTQLAYATTTDINLLLWHPLLVDRDYKYSVKGRWK